jgi:hypothetical protein
MLAELNRWFRTITEMHQPTLELKLRIFKFLKLLSHVSAQSHKTSRSMRQHVLATRVVVATRPWGSVEEWKQFCATPPQESGKEKTSLLQAKLKAWSKKKGLGMKLKKKAMRKRTVFTRLFKGVKVWRARQVRKSMKGM